MTSALSIYILTSRNIGQNKAIEAVANNVANASTTGYKKQGVDFETLVGGSTSQPSGQFSRDRGFRTDFSAGDMDRTDNPLDMAIGGDGFFAVQGQNGGPIRYTRDGHFTLDQNRNLVTMRGENVLDRDKTPINIPVEYTFDVASDGTVSNKDGSIAQIGVFKFAPNAPLLRVGDNEFSAGKAVSTAADAADYKVFTGMVEGSNVNPVMETVKMQEVSRSYQNSSRLISRLEDLEDRAIRDLGKPAQ